VARENLLHILDLLGVAIPNDQRPNVLLAAIADEIHRQGWDLDPLLNINQWIDGPADPKQWRAPPGWAISDEGKRKIAEAQRRRWAKQKARR
jgi:hypothetical protein